MILDQLTIGARQTKNAPLGDPMCILAVVVVVVRNPARLCLPPTIAQMPREPRLIVCRGFLLLRATKQLLQTQTPGSGSRQ